MCRVNEIDEEDGGDGGWSGIGGRKLNFVQSILVSLKDDENSCPVYRHDEAFFFFFSKVVSSREREDVGPFVDGYSGGTRLVGGLFWGDVVLGVEKPYTTGGVHYRYDIEGPHDPIMSLRIWGRSFRKTKWSRRSGRHPSFLY